MKKTIFIFVAMAWMETGYLAAQNTYEEMHPWYRFSWTEIRDTGYDGYLFNKPIDTTNSRNRNLPYTATGFYDDYRGLTFWSMDRTASQDAIVATGGDYWIVKSIPLITSGHPCYKPVSVDVYKIYDIDAVGRCSIYPPCFSNFISTPDSPRTTTVTLSGTCY